jgi:hypothetical protein
MNIIIAIINAVTEIITTLIKSRLSWILVIVFLLLYQILNFDQILAFVQSIFK